jgi:hypothetical protein
MKQKYLKKVEDIRVAHRDIANYFLEAFIESKPLVDMARNVQIRYLNNILIFKYRYTAIRTTVFYLFLEEIMLVVSSYNSHFSILKQLIITDD